MQELPKLLRSRSNYSDECFLASYEDTFCVLGACSVWNESEAAHTALGHNIMPTSHYHHRALEALVLFTLHDREFAFYL